MNASKISVIVPVYNTEKYLRRCVDSILAQTYTDFELLLIDDGSTDGSGAICDEYAALDPRVRVFHKPNGGVSSARNLGLDHSRGEWVGFIDGDDWLDSKTLEKVTENMQSAKADIVCFGFWSVTKDKENFVKLPSIKHGKISFMREQMLHGWTVVWNTFFRNEFLNRHSIRFQTCISIGEDLELLFRTYYYATNIIIIDEPLYYYNRMNENSALHKMIIKHYDDIIQANLSVIQFFKEKGIINEFQDIVAWKILRAKQDYVLDVSTHAKFLSIYPECHRYILSCPTINRKIKLMMWLLTHKMGWATRLIVQARKLLKRDT